MIHQKRYLYTLAALLILVGCGRSSVVYLPQSLTINVNEHKSVLQATLLKQDLENYNNLYVHQRILRLSNNDLVVYEEAITDELFEFENTTSWLVSRIFDAKKLHKLYAKDHLYVFQVQLPNGQILNLIAQQDDTQELRLIYGMRTQKLMHILKAMDNTDLKDIYHHDVITIKNTDKAIWSKWSVTKIHFTPLITPLRHVGGP